MGEVKALDGERYGWSATRLLMCDLVIVLSNSSRYLCSNDAFCPVNSFTTTADLWFGFKLANSVEGCSFCDYVANFSRVHREPVASRRCRGTRAHVIFAMFKKSPRTDRKRSVSSSCAM